MSSLFQSVFDFAHLEYPFQESVSDIVISIITVTDTYHPLREQGKSTSALLRTRFFANAWLSPRRSPLLRTPVAWIASSCTLDLIGVINKKSLPYLVYLECTVEVGRKSPSMKLL